MENKLHRLKSVYFIGIGGISMSSLALILKSKGIKVAGYDFKQSENTALLEENGVCVFYEHKQANLDGFDTVVFTAAIHEDDPELCEAKARGMEILTRAELLGMITGSYRHSVGVAGTHGKSTTTGMLSEIFLGADAGSTILAGAVLPSIGSTFRCGNGEYAVFEACEYMNSYHAMRPTIKVILNVEHDHVDCFPTIEDVIKSFHTFIDVPREGTSENIAVVNADCQNARFAAAGTRADVRFVSIREKTDFYATAIDLSDGYGAFDFWAGEEKLFAVKLKVPGLHNVSNASAAAAAAILAGVDAKLIAAGLCAFPGVKRRFETKGFYHGATVVDDYAHHPDEITATLLAAKQLPFQRVLCVFQPHTFSRTKSLLPDFVKALSLADQVILADIYAAREQNTCGISSMELAQMIDGAVYYDSFEKIAQAVKEYAREGDILLTMGAGDVCKICDLILS